MKEVFGKILMTWWFQITWAVVMLLILIWNISIGSPIGTLIAAAGLGAMAFTLQIHWQAQERQKYWQDQNRETTRQWTEDDL